MRKIDPEQQAKPTRFDLTEYGRILWRKRYFLLLPTVLAGVIAVVGVRFIVPVYKSSSLLRLENQTPQFEGVTPLMTLEEQRTAVDEEMLARAKSEILSSDFLDKVIRHLGLADNVDLIAAAQLDRQTRYPDLSVEELVHRRLRNMLRGKIEVTAAGVGVFRISAFDHSPSTCYKMATAITDLFLEAQRLKELKWLREASEFSDEQLEVYKERLDESEGEFERVQNELTTLALQKNPVGETSARYAATFGGESNLRYAETLKEQLETTITNQERIVDKLHERLTTKFGKVPHTKEIWDDTKLKSLEKGLIAFYETQLVLQLGARGVTGDDQAKTRLAVREEEQNLQRYITEQVTVKCTDVPAEYKPLVTEYFFQVILLRGVNATRDRLQTDIESYKDKLDRTPRLEAELERLRQRVAADRELYNTFLKAKTSAQITEAVQNTELGMTVDVIEKPARPLNPDRPNRRNILIFVVVIGCTLGMMGLVLSEYLDTSFRTVKEIESQLGLRVLGTIPNTGVSSRWNKARSRRQVVIWVVVSIAAIGLSVGGFYLSGLKAKKQGIRVYAVQPVEQGGNQAP